MSNQLSCQCYDEGLQKRERPIKAMQERRHLWPWCSYTCFDRKDKAGRREYIVSSPTHHSILHGLLPFFFGLSPGFCWNVDWLCWRVSISCPTAVLTASSKTSSTPRISLLLHSTYTAFMRFATAWPCSGVTGVRPWVLRRSMQARLVRRSDLRPTRIRGVVGQKWRTSGYHCMLKSDGFVRNMGDRSLPYPLRSPKSLGSQWQSKRREGRFLGRRVVEVYRTLLALPYPREQVQRSCLSEHESYV